MRKNISTKEIADRFGKVHRNLMRDVARLLEHDDPCVNSMFVKSSYISLQNKRLSCYTMGVSGFCLITDTWGYSRGRSAPVKAEILSEFGETFVVVGSARTRHEDNFYRMLTEFLSKDKVIKQFPIGGHRVDFYLPDYSLVIEYDEEGHFSAAAKRADEGREVAVRHLFSSEFDDSVIFVRVSKGDELAGLSRIAATIALCTSNATGITKYAE